MNSWHYFWTRIVENWKFSSNIWRDTTQKGLNNFRVSPEGRAGADVGGALDSTWRWESAFLGGLLGRDVAWEPSVSRESSPQAGWEMERQVLRILRFSDFPFAFLFYPEHPHLVDDLSWLKPELNTHRMWHWLAGWDPQVSGIVGQTQISTCWLLS